MTRAKTCVGAALAAVTLAMLGCGTPGPPLPPSLNLPDPVTDLAAVRNGNQVTLTWTMPKHNTDKLSLKSSVSVHVCRREAAAPCAAVVDLNLAPASAGSFIEELSATLAAGPTRAVSYFVEVKNRNGRSAGLSNPAVILAGKAPAPITGLAAEVRRTGIVLRWIHGDPQQAVRLHRKLLTPHAAQGASGPLAPPAPPIDRNLLVDSDTGRVEDQDIVLGNSYEYRAQRVARTTIGDRTVELAGETTSPIRVDAQDVFPPAIPTGLVAVASEPVPGTPAFIDLNWQPVADSGLSGYYVYRREEGMPWQRISGDQPVSAAAFHDTHILAGHTYRYGASAVDQLGHESARSSEAVETVPGP